MQHGRTTEYGDTHDFTLSLVDSLGELFFTDGEIDEEQLAVHSPPDQYAMSCFSVAALRAYAKTKGDNYRRLGVKMLRYLLELPEGVRGHYEFNSFALLEAVEDARDGQYDLPVPERSLVDHIRYSSSVQTRDGNNWLLLQALCRLKYSELFRDPDERQQAMELLSFSNRWQLHDGVIADEPRYRLAPIQTPLTYHAKCSMLYTRIANRVPDPAVRDRAERSLRTLSRVCLPNGECLFFGRSENTIFGYACAIDAMSRSDATPTASGWLTATRRLLVKFLLDRFDAERINCQPGRFSDDDQRLDSYIYDAVYGSYAAMLLLGVPPVSPPTDEQETGLLGRKNESFDHSGLLSARGDQSALGMATVGQLRPRNSGPDFRYAGLLPHTFIYDGRSVLPGIPTSAYETEATPFLPTIDDDSTQYVPAVWNSIIREDDSTLTISGDGCYFAVSKTGETSGSARSGSLLDAVKRQVKRHEKLRQYGERTHRSLRRVLRASRLDLVYQNYVDRPVSLPARTRRAVHFIQDEDVLALQTATVTSADLRVLPSSAVISESEPSEPGITYSPEVGRTQRTAMTHKGPADWHVPRQWSDSRRTWSVVLVDPAGSVESAESYVADDVLKTHVETTDGTTTLTTSLAEPTEISSIDARPR